MRPKTKISTYFIGLWEKLKDWRQDWNTEGVAIGLRVGLKRTGAVLKD